MSFDFVLQILEYLNLYELHFVSNPPERLKCILCKLVLINAKQTVCGCKACESCITNYLGDEEKQCPSAECSGTKLTLKRDILSDNATNKEVANLKVKCPFKSCNVVDSIKHMLVHVKTCDYKTIKCPKCSDTYMYKEEHDHVDIRCKLRLVKCIYCSLKMSFEDLNNFHLDHDSEFLCEMYITDCPNNCGANMTLLKKHMKICSKKKFRCPLKCDSKKMAKEDLTNYFKDELISHNLCLVDELGIIRNENKILFGEFRRLDTLTMENNKVITKLVDLVNRHEKDIVHLKLKNQVIAPNVRKVGLFRNGALIWKIKEFNILKSDAEAGTNISIVSDPFYTSEFGYKLCLKMYPFGDGIGRGHYLSLYFVIMKGENDGILSWPFKQKVTLAIMDQKDKIKHHSETFKPDPQSPCLHRPVSDCNIATGSPKFIALSSLSSDSTYYCNDTFYIKAVVDTIGISRP